jgi:hypothetical protein
MMKSVFSLSFACFLAACTSAENRKLPAYEVINEVWKKNGRVQDLEGPFGRPDIHDSQKTEHMFPNSKIPRMHFNFNAQGQLETALLFLEQHQLDEFKAFINCDWLEKKGKRQIVDVIDKTHEGRCKTKPIRFIYFSALNAYEIWWDKK